MALSRITVWSPGNVLTAQALNAEFDNLVSGVNAAGGVLPTAFTIGDLVYASTTAALSALADVATGNALISGGVGVAPSWGKIGLTTHVSGILPGANGGTANGFFAVAGPATSLKTFTFPNASDTVATLGVANTFTATQTVKNLSGASTIFIMDTTDALGSIGNYLSYRFGGVEKGYVGYSSSASTNMVVNNNNGNLLLQSVSGNVGIGMTPTKQLELSTDSAQKPTTNTWTITSDARIKTIQRKFIDGLDIVRQINPVWYRYNGKGGMVDNGEHVGIIAQELQPVAPYMIGASRGRLVPNEAETDILDYQGHALPFILVNAIKTLDARLTAGGL